MRALQAAPWSLVQSEVQNGQSGTQPTQKPPKQPFFASGGTTSVEDLALERVLPGFVLQEAHLKNG